VYNAYNTLRLFTFCFFVFETIYEGVKSRKEKKQIMNAVELIGVIILKFFNDEKTK